MSIFSFVLRARRRELSLTQLKLGLMSKICPKQLSAYERGERLPSREHFARLQDHLGRLPSPPPTFQVPEHNDEWRLDFRDRSEWEPPEQRDLACRMKAARLAYPHRIADLQPVIRRHEAWLEASRHGSGVELLTSLLVLDSPDSVELSVKLLAWGFRSLPVQDPITREVRCDYPFPAIGFPLEGGRAVIVQQVPLRANDQPFVVDGLIGISIGRQRLWVAWEADGPGHRTYADQLRQARLATVRFSEAEILAPTFVQDLKRRLRGLIL